MKKLLLSLIIPFISFALSAQELDTIIVKNNCEYRFRKIETWNGITMANKTTDHMSLELYKIYKPGDSEWKNESSVVKEQMRSEDTNIKNHFIKIFKETFKDSNLPTFNHKLFVLFRFAVGASGNIIHLDITLDKNILDIIGHDKLIEFEINIKKNYKFKPLINQKIKSLGYFWLRLDAPQLNEAFK